MFGCFLGVVFVGLPLSQESFNPTATLRFGRMFGELVEHVDELIPQDIIVFPEAGHDGKFFFVQALDPFYLNPEEHARFLDRPAYRAQRMLYPALGSLGGVLSPWATAWGLIVVNVVAMGVGTYFTARVAERLSISRWFGLAFPLNVGLIMGQMLSGAEVVATAALMAGVHYVMASQLLPAVVALAMSVLARETMAIAVVGLMAFWLVEKRKKAWCLLVPISLGAGWWVFVHMRLAEGLSQDTAAIGFPFQGFIGASTAWLKSGRGLLHGAAALVVTGVLLTVLVRSIRYRSALAWSVAGFAVMGIFMSAPVWSLYYNSTRTVAPAITACVLLILADRNDRSELRGGLDSLPQTSTCRHR